MHFTVYSKPACPQCDAAKALLMAADKQFSVINLDVGQEKQADEAYISRDELIGRFPTARMMPQVTVETSTSALHIGSLPELKKYLTR